MSQHIRVPYEKRVQTFVVWTRFSYAERDAARRRLLVELGLDQTGQLAAIDGFAGKHGTSGFDDATHVLGADRVHFCHGVGDGFGVVLVAGGRRQEGFQEIGLGGFGSGLVRQSLFWMSANVRLIGLSLALSLAFIAAILAFFSVSFIDMFVPLFLTVRTPS